MYTAQDIFNITADLIDERLANGTINATTTAVYKARTPGILNLWQSENVNNGDLYKTHEISNTPIPNLLGLTSGFDIKEFIGTDLTFEGQGQPKAYYFEADAPCTVYIEDFTTQWNTLATITVPDSITSFTAFKGIVTPTDGSTKCRIRATGQYYFRIVNRALFGVTFQADRIPTYRPWVMHQMPDDFKSIDQIIDEVPDRQYTKETSYKWEGRKDLYINYYFIGNIRIVYKPVPVQITALTQTLEVDEVTSMSAAYFLAAHLLTEDPNSASFFNQRYLELKALSNTKTPASIQDIIDVYSMGGVNNG